jgi:Ca2+:H+ antiporter
MVLIASLTTALVTNSGRSAWFIGALIVTVYVMFAMTLYLLPPKI